MTTQNSCTMTFPVNDASVHQAIEEILRAHPVVLFMKGDPHRPLCGFSATVAQVLHYFKVPFHGVNVLEDQAMREGIKAYTGWPTIPQLYVNRQFIGGCDIVKTLYENKELETILEPYRT